MKIAEKKAKAKPEASPLSQIDIGSFGRRIVGILTRNFFNMKNVALGIAFMINILLLFYRASPINAGSDSEDGENDGEEADDDLYLSGAWPDLGGRHQSAHYRRARYQSYQGNNIINQQRGVDCRSFHVFITRILQSWKVLG